MSNEKINSITASNYWVTPKLIYYGSEIIVQFNGSCLKHDKITYNHGKILNIYIAFKISKNYDISSYPMLKNCLFGAVSLTKNVDNEYSGYDIEFDRKGTFSSGNGFGGNMIIFGVDMSLFPHIINKGKDILILGEGSTQGLEHTLTTEKLYSINFTKNN